MDREMSPQALEMIAGRFRVLSEPIRLRIINYLRDGELSVTELTDLLTTSQSNVSKHLKILTNDGILQRDQRGNTVYYAIADESIFDLCEVVCDALEQRFKERAELFA